MWASVARFVALRAEEALRRVRQKQRLRRGRARYAGEHRDHTPALTPTALTAIAPPLPVLRKPVNVVPVMRSTASEPPTAMARVSIAPAAAKTALAEMSRLTPVSLNSSAAVVTLENSKLVLTVAGAPSSCTSTREAVAAAGETIFRRSPPGRRQRAVDAHVARNRGSADARVMVAEEDSSASTVMVTGPVPRVASAARSVPALLLSAGRVCGVSEGQHCAPRA